MFWDSQSISLALSLVQQLLLLRLVYSVHAVPTRFPEPSKCPGPALGDLCLGLGRSIGPSLRGFDAPGQQCGVGEPCSCEWGRLCRETWCFPLFTVQYLEGRRPLSQQCPWSCLHGVFLAQCMTPVQTPGTDALPGSEWRFAPGAAEPTERGQSVGKCP